MGSYKPGAEKKETQSSKAKRSFSVVSVSLKKTKDRSDLNRERKDV